ncbi:MAG: asparagine synthase (glutamine-hydrolyzing) [Chloroflexota bacterium]
MTGIAGMIDLTRQNRADGELVRRMVGALRHRGPDSDGFYDSPDLAFGASRLGIIDLQRSIQPLYNEDRTIALIFDGEIYNYRELREQLKRRNHILNTDGDGETIVHLYEEYGLTLFSHLRGMFAFALWDNANRRLLLAVDHVGMKPLYLYERDDTLFFASEIKAFFRLPDMPRRVNVDALDTYLSFGYMMDDQTLFEGVRRLPPGHAITIESNKPPTLQAFWELPKPAHDNRAQPEGILINETRELLADVIRIHLRSDAPLGIFVDDGLESAALLAFASRELGANIKTFSVGGNPENDSHIQRLSDHFQADHHPQNMTADHWWRALEKFIEYADEPVANAEAIPFYLLAESTRPYVKTVLSGWAAPAVFGGYPAHYAIPQFLTQRRATNLNSAPMQTILGTDESAQNPTRVHANTVTLQGSSARLKPVYDAVFDDDLRAKLYNPNLLGRAKNTLQTFETIIARSWRDDPYDTAQALVMNMWLAGNTLLSLDRVTMAASLEARLPFFDPILLKFTANIPPALRLRDHQYLLREAARPYLPNFALERPPQTRTASTLSWLDEDLSGRIRELLLNPNAFVTEFFNRAALETLLKDHFWGRAKHPEIIFRLLILELWGQRYIKAPIFNG